MLYDYHHSPTRLEREKTGNDHCASAGSVLVLSELVSDGRIRLPDHLILFNVVHAMVDGKRRKLIYAISEDLRIHLAPDGSRGTPNAVKHETLFHNAPVIAAGELLIDVDGIVSDVNDHSGSYGTIGRLLADPDFARAVLDSCDIAGVILTRNERQRLTVLAKR